MATVNQRVYGPVDAIDVTPNDTVSAATAITSNLASGNSSPAGVLLTVSGNVTFIMQTGRQITLPLAAEMSHAVQFTHILATGTTATGIKALFQ